MIPHIPDAGGCVRDQGRKLCVQILQLSMQPVEFLRRVFPDRLRFDLPRDAARILASEYLAVIPAVADISFCDAADASDIVTLAGISDTAPIEAVVDHAFRISGDPADIHDVDKFLIAEGCDIKIADRLRQARRNIVRQARSHARRFLHGIRVDFAVVHTA